MNEDEILDRVAVERLLARLDEADRLLLLMVHGIEFPPDWGARPVTFTTIGAYLGLRFEGAPLSEAAIRNRRKVLLSHLRGERDGLRRTRRTKARKTPE